jgi:predicted AAA+ superfamily ATPase
MGSVLGGHQIGRSMENCVYLHLVRRQQREGGSKLYFWKDRAREVDFVIAKGDLITDLIQVTHSMEGDTLSREIKGFDGLARSSDKDCSKTIITWTGEEETPDGIEVVPLWKFLLESG